MIFNLPGVNYFRHLGLLFPIVKFYLIIVAAFGFKTFIENIRFENSKKIIRRFYKIFFYIFIFQFVMTVIFVLNKKINLNDIHYDHSRILIIFISIFFIYVFFRRYEIKKNLFRVISSSVLLIYFIDGVTFYTTQTYTFMTEISNESYKIFNANKKFDYSEKDISILQRIMTTQNGWVN